MHTCRSNYKPMHLKVSVCKQYAEEVKHKILSHYTLVKPWLIPILRSMLLWTDKSKNMQKTLTEDETA